MQIFTMNIKSLILILTICCISSSSKAQEAKGGSKIGSSFSKFRENISSVQLKRQQQQPIQRQQVINEEEITRNTINTQQINRPTIINQQQETFSKQVVVDRTESVQQQEADSEPTTFGSVQGTAGVDYPAYTSIPNTQFSCDQVPFDPGMYADQSTGCQVYHLCYQGRRESFLCGIGTIFNQAILNCDFWYSVECSKSSQYYQLNADFGKSSSEPTSSGGFSSSSSSSSSFSKTSFVQPPRVSVPTSNIIEVQRTTSQISRPIPAQLPNRVSSFSSQSEFSSSSIGGKISPPKYTLQQQQSSFSSSGKTTSVEAKEQWQRQGLLSPGRRRIALQNQQSVPQLSESSMQENFTSNKTNLIDNQPSLSKTNFAGQTSNFGPFSGLKGGQPQEQQQQPTGSGGGGGEQQEAWKPYFKNKSPKVIGSSATSPAAPQQSTTLAPQPVGSTANLLDDVSPSTQAAANQEPTFSVNGNSPATPAAEPVEPPATSQPSEEVPKVPKSNPPPIEAPQEPPSTTTTTATESSSQPADQEPPATITTTQSAGEPVDMSSSSPPPPPPTVSEEKSIETSVANSGAPETTTTTGSSPPPPEATNAPTMTTTASTQVEPTSPSEPEATGETSEQSGVGTSETSGDSGSSSSNSSKKKKKKKKKRQGSSVLTSSSVEYANQH